MRFNYINTIKQKKCVKKYLNRLQYGVVTTIQATNLYLTLI